MRCSSRCDGGPGCLTVNRRVDRRRCEFALAPELVARSTVPASRPETSSNAPFPTTRWSQVARAGERVGDDACAALAELCAAYWISYAQIAIELGLTEAAVQQAASRLRKRYREALRDEIAATLDNPSDQAVETEIRDLFDALGR